MGIDFTNVRSMAIAPLQSRWWQRISEHVEGLLDLERDQLALWIPVGLGSGIAAWFVLDTQAQWIAWLLVMAAGVLAAWLLPLGGRFRRALLIGSIASAIGCCNALEFGKNEVFRDVGHYGFQSNKQVVHVARVYR